MTLHSITTSPTLTTPETEKVKKLRSKDENRRIWLVEKNGHRSIETMHDLDKPDPYVKFLKRKGFYINEIPPITPNNLGGYVLEEINYHPICLPIVEVNK